MIRCSVFGLVLLAIATPASARDTRLASRLYSADEVVRIDGRAGVQATIAFAENEHIENVAIGDSNGWQVTPNKRANLLFVKPLAPSARTNLTVVTDRRSYFFDLVASPSARPLYLLRFTYPPESKSDVAQPTAPGLTAAETQVALGEQPVDPAHLNHAWRARGKAKLLPSQIYDDGKTTYLAWTSGTPIPAILIRNDKGEEGPVNFAVRDDVIVIDGVPELIVLRSGRDSATLENRRTQAQPGQPTQVANAGGARPEGEPTSAR